MVNAMTRYADDRARYDMARLRRDLAYAPH